MIAAGTAVRLVIAFEHYGVFSDIEAYAIVDDALRADWSHAYETMRWTYPSGFFPWILTAGWLSRTFDLAFNGVIKLASIAADAALAYLVQSLLGRRGYDARTRLLATAAVAFGPIFILGTAWNGQLDSFAILPAVAALAVWLGGGERRGPIAGGLIGLAASVKTVPIFLVLALLPSARDARERLVMAAAAVAVPVVLLVPFLIGDHTATVDSLRSNHGFPGYGGLSLALQPRLIDYWVFNEFVQPTDLVIALRDAQQLIVAGAVALVGIVLWRRRVDPVTGAATIWLTVFAANPDFFFTYLIWGLPFFLIAGWVRATIALQLALMIPAALLYRIALEPTDLTISIFYRPLVLGAWLAMIAALALLLARIWTRRYPISSAAASLASSSRADPGSTASPARAWGRR